MRKWSKSARDELLRLKRKDEERKRRTSVRERQRRAGLLSMMDPRLEHSLLSGAGNAPHQLPQQQPLFLSLFPGRHFVPNRLNLLARLFG